MEYCKRIAGITSVLLATSTVHAQPARGLEDLFSLGFAIEDRNADQVADFVDAELVTGDNPSPWVAAAAADVAVRLGLETMAMDLPWSAGPDSVGIAIGTKAATELGLDLSGLRTGEGLITVFRNDEREWIVIAGSDELGTRRAATTFAGRLPSLWDPKGNDFDDVFDTVGEALSNATLDAFDVRIAHVVTGEDGLVELGLAVDVETNQVRLARRAIQNASPSFPEVETITLQLPGVEDLLLVRSGDGPPEGPRPARPGSGPKRNLNLSNLFTPDGLLGDGDSNLIADRIDVALSPAHPYRGTLNLAARLGLESTGLSVPIVRLPDEIEDPADEPTLVLIGRHPLLNEDTIPEEDLSPGEGLDPDRPEGVRAQGRRDHCGRR